MLRALSIYCGMHGFGTLLDHLLHLVHPLEAKKTSLLSLVYLCTYKHFEGQINFSLVHYIVGLLLAALVNLEALVFLILLVVSVK